VIRKDTPGWTLSDNRPAMPGYKEKKADEQKESINNVIDFCGVDLTERGIHIELAGDLVCASGVGASAASSVAFARALDDEFNLQYNLEEINKAGYEGERGYHGVPSGIDNTASTYGGLIWFIRNMDGGPPKFETLKLEDSMHLVIASTGLTASTKEVVGDVRKKKDSDPSWFDNLVKTYIELVNDARKALLDLDRMKVGELMNKNHGLLRDLTVSCHELDNLVDIARQNGALGSKMTGTGRGGNMITLAQNRAEAEKIAKALEEGGAVASWITEFGL
jgi:mevalonate kinase